MSDISQRIVNLSPEKRALFELQLKRKTKEGRDIFAVPKRAKQTPVPLSFAQQRLWYLQQFEPSSAAYNNTLAFRMKGLLNNRALQKSLNRIVSRHESLRTTFKVIEGQPFQDILPHLEVVIALEDLRSLPSVRQEMKVDQLHREIGLKPFDLETGPLLRATLLCLDLHEHILLLSIHHITTDGWSQGIFLRELSNLYTSYAFGKPEKLPELAIQYADFSQWQREFLHGDVLEQQLSYWKGQLANLSTLNLPTDRPRQPIQTYRGAKRLFTLDNAITQSIISLCRNERVTTYMTLLAAFNVLLFRYSDQEDILVGTPIANRNRTELEDLIGFFVNTLVLRTDLSGNPSFRELLIRVRNVALEGFNHQDLPFEKLVEKLLLERDLSRHPLFQVMFVFQNTPTEKLEFDDVTITNMDVGNDHAKFDLTLEVTQKDGVLKGSIEYNTDLYNQETIELLSEHYQVLLAGIIANPERCISELPLLTVSERHQLLVDWNSTRSQYPDDKSIQEIFEDQVRKSPEAVAILDGNHQLTFSELNRRANQLANYLRTLEVGVETLVGLFMERSFEMVIAILGILKAGGAYVPLDPYYPQERLTYMLEDSRTPVLVTHKKLIGSQPATNARVVYLDDEKALEWKNEENPRCETTPDNLAYVMYTSGTTGKPKGVAIPHRGVVRLVCGQEYGLFDTKQRFLLLAPISFDASTFELWGALLHGASVVVYPGRYPSVALLGKFIQQYSITTLWLTSSLFNVIVDQAPEILAPLKELFTGGEALSMKHVRRARQHLPHTELINGYGPTESTTFACCYTIEDEIDETTASVPIGKPIANTQIYILDKFLNPVPVGVVGELYIGGDGLARGYLNRPDLTSKVFIPDPFSEKSDTYIYKTGDLAKYHSDGNIDFIGRLDQQVKLRGFRIELSEIEVTLGTHPAIKQVIACVKEIGPGDHRLVSYYELIKSITINVGDLRSYLNKKLPDYMVPQHFIELDKFPLTPVGKVDRKYLSTIDVTHPGLSSYEPPRNEIESKLTEIWQTVLDVQQIGIHDNFFELGGHSIIATRITSKIRVKFNLEVPLRIIFEYPTIANQAGFIEDALISDEMFGSSYQLSGNDREDFTF